MDKTKFIPHLSDLKSYLLDKIKDNYSEMQPGESVKALNNKRARSLVLEKLPYFIRSSYFFVIQIIKYQIAICEARPNLNSGLHNISNDEHDSISFMTDSFFNSTRRALDTLLPYIGISYSISLPNSMNELMKKIDNTEIALPIHIKQILKSYWSEHGKKLKAYRDLGQHHTLVSSEGWIAKESSGTYLIHQLLPNNPEEKSQLKLKYSDPLVLALPYIAMEFSYVLGFIFRITDLLIPAEVKRDIDRRLIVFNSAVATGAPMEMHPIQDEKPFNDEIERYLLQLATWSLENRFVERPPFNP